MEVDNNKINTLQDFLQSYEIDFTHSLDQKGLGSVYISEDKATHQTLAVKSIEMHPMFDKGLVQARYRAAIDLSHPNLLSYFAAYRFEAEATVQNFVLMPYIEEGNLQAWLPKLHQQQKIELIAGILEALAYLHSKGHVWQNLRSDHILIKKVQDILLPLCINYGAKEALAPNLFVYYEYLAPEQLTDEESLDISTRTDIWSLGVLIYELFTGQLPFGKKSPQSPNKKIQSRILEAEIPTLITAIPQPYQAVVRKCLEKEPENRWNDIEEIKTYIAENPLKLSPKKLGILETLEKMGEAEDKDSADTSTKTKLPLLQRKVKRKPSKPVGWLEVFLWLVFAILVGYLLSIWS